MSVINSLELINQLAKESLDKYCSKADVELIVLYILDIERNELYRSNPRVDKVQLKKIKNFIERRNLGEPIAYMLCNKGFWNLEFIINPSVLVPRPETELLVETILSFYNSKPLKLLDLGTGSGAIGLSLLSERPTWEVYCSDLSFDALKVAKENNSVDEIKESIIDKAKQMADEDIKINQEMGKHGSQLFENNDSVMTHCNAGALATVGYGTALGVIRATKESGKNIKVIATETRPVQQGSRLTAFELKHDGINVTIIPDTAVGYTMANNLVNRVVVGADRILRTGHVYNKIGTYQVATMANQHNIPFYVAAPLSTFDMKSNPEDVIIEQRKGSEVTGIGDKKTAPDGIDVINPAFDMTPPELIAGIITEKGVAKPPFNESIKKLF